MRCPCGYVWDADGAIQFDPDEQVQAVVRLIFAQFEELGTLGGLLRYLARHDIRLGVRVREGPGKGQLVWRRPNRATLQNLLKHPLYAGAYVYGRRQMDRRRYQPEHPQSGRVVMSRADWHALLPDRCPAYLSWEQYERNQARLAANRARASTLGAVRHGAALLAGLVVCARCGVRLGVHYQQSHGRPIPFTYDCAAPTQSLRRSALPACRRAESGRLCHRSTSSRRSSPRRWSCRWPRRSRSNRNARASPTCGSSAANGLPTRPTRAARQYQAVEPENRLVARTLERAWEEKLQAQQALEEEYHRVLQQHPRVLTSAERAAIRRLAADIPALWHATTTTAADRKEIIRQVVERVEVDAQGASEQVQVRITWAGGGQTAGVLIRPIARYRDRTDYARHVCPRPGIDRAGWSLDAIARQLEADSYPPLHRRQRWSRASVQTLQRQLRSGQHASPRPLTRGARSRGMVGTGGSRATGRAPVLAVHLDPAWGGASTQGAWWLAALDRMGRCGRARALACVSPPRHWRRTAPSLDGRAEQLRTPERVDRMTNTNRPIGLEAGSSSAPSPGRHQRRLSKDYERLCLTERGLDLPHA